MQEATLTNTTPGSRHRVADPDAALIALCREFDAGCAKLDELHLATHDDDRRRIEAWQKVEALAARGWEIRAAVTGLQARTPEGLLAKAKLALWETCDGGPDGGRREGSDTQVAWSLARDVLRGMSARQKPAQSVQDPSADRPINPDAELIALCAQHIANLAAYNTEGGYLEPEEDPLWKAYRRSYDAIESAQPQTTEGMVAKARAAKVEAGCPNGTETPENGPAARWAWQLMNDMLRLSGNAGA